jgi:sigma-B regulation protein RsbU (phosphoserine phosphatase)
MEETLRITAAVEKLNRVISHSALASSFISLFYAELELDGLMVYVNAGHPPPLIFDGETFTELDRGGLILGPKPDARYSRGYAHLHPGSILVAYTDGIPEAVDSRGDEFGVVRLKALIQEGTWTSARELVETVFDAVQRFSGTEIPTDDQTVVAVRRGEPPTE